MTIGQELSSSVPEALYSASCFFLGGPSSNETASIPFKSPSQVFSNAVPFLSTEHWVLRTQSTRRFQCDNTSSPYPGAYTPGSPGLSVEGWLPLTLLRASDRLT